MDVGTLYKVRQVLNYYGGDKQKLKAIEELTELQEIIIKEINKGEKVVLIERIVDEIADVYIMLKQLELIYTDANTIKQRIDYKLGRQLKRIERESEVKSEN